MPSKEAEHHSEELSRLVMILARAFIQRWDMYPKQLPPGSYITVHERLSPEHLFAHLKGELTLGTYLLNVKGQGRFAVLDADTEAGWQLLREIAPRLFHERIPSYLEDSRRGGHLWLFFSAYLSAAEIRQFASGLMSAYHIPSEIELYPKQVELVTGPGSLIRLPFGIHHKTGRRYGFSTPMGKPLASTLRDQLSYFVRPLTVSAAAFRSYCQRGVEETRKTAAPSFQPLSKPVTVYEATGRAQVSEKIKAAISVRAFIEQFMPEVQLTEAGRGFCPFHDDHARSFGVNADRNFWRCFAEGCPGYSGATIIDLWMLWRSKRGTEIGFTQAVKELAELLL